MNASAFSSITSGILFASGYNIMGSACRGIIKSQVLSTQTYGSHNSVKESGLDKFVRVNENAYDCMSAATLVFSVSMAIFDHTINPKFMLIPAVIIPLAARGVVYFTENNQNYKGLSGDFGLIEKNLGGLFNIATLITSIALFPAVLYTGLISNATVFSITLITGAMIGADAYCLLKTCN